MFLSDLSIQRSGPLIAWAIVSLSEASKSRLNSVRLKSCPTKLCEKLLSNIINVDLGSHGMYEI